MFRFVLRIPYFIVLMLKHSPRKEIRGSLCKELGQIFLDDVRIRARPIFSQEQLPGVEVSLRQLCETAARAGNWQGSIQLMYLLVKNAVRGF